jgi:hypothetical protein
MVLGSQSFSNVHSTGGEYDPTAAYPNGLPCIFEWAAPSSAFGWIGRAGTSAATATLLLLPIVAMNPPAQPKLGLVVSFSLLALYFYNNSGN